MNLKDSFTKKAVNSLISFIISTMPKRCFTTQEKSDEFMLTGDGRFSYVPGEKWTCGFGKVSFTPADYESETYYIAGYDSNNPVKGVLDDLYARAVYLDDNRENGGVIFCALDCVGISRKDINDIKKLVLESGRLGKIKSINICATHTHAGIDTQGLWGEKIYKSGKNKAFMENLKKAAAQAVIEAFENKKDGRLFMSHTPVEDMQADVRTPETYDKNLTRFRFLPDDKSGDIYIVNFASHAELLGTTSLISADFPAYLIKEIEENAPGSNAVFFNGAIGGMISAKEIKKVYRDSIDCEAYMKSFGKQLGIIALGIEKETELQPILNIKSKGIVVPGDNTVLILARFLKVLNNDIGRTNKRNKACIYSEVGYMELGDKDVAVFLVPGELFPELYNGEFLTEKDSANHRPSSYKKVLADMTDCKHKFVIGLCNDELGYILAENDFLLNETLPYINKATDDMDRDHYEETNSTGPGTGKIILDETENLIKTACN
ncbi:MAG: neutral/alkaline non-lysosomal ceramidase N-terminal domain-containing protein [Clostridia bacterium]|nr:neutral/alkaline non-lysosomal ceramidase N-terminal domain-containing protein [Clostridia bacterium]